jgi:hypothetical protein
MRRGRFVIALLATSAAVLVTAAGALSATPRQIYADLAQHGKLTKNYSPADLRRAAQDANVEGYGGVGTQTYKPVVQHAAAAPRTSNVLGTAVAPTQAGTLPFTGLQLGVFVALGLALLAGGMLLRRAGRNGSSA